MAGFGYGYGFRKSARKGGGDITPPPAPVPIATLEPDAAWDGSAGSGFAAVPVDPERLTAKPAMRLMVAPSQHFTEELLVGVMAGANDSGSMFDTMGLDHVTLHLEGAQQIIPEPQFATFDDANGVPRTYFGWWARIRKPVGLAGEMQAYFEAVPRDASMQNRVIGPFSFHASEVLHDIEVEVAVTPAEVPGSRYRSIGAALLYLRTQGAQNPRITIAEAGDYVMGSAGAVYGGSGYCTITASAPVNIVGPDSSASFVAFRPLWKGLRFHGSNITIDFRYSPGLIHETGGPARQFWFDGCNLTNSAGRESLFRKNIYDGASYLIGGEPIFTECNTTNLHRAAIGAELARGNRLTQCWSDAFNGANCVVYNEIEDFDSRWFREDILAMMLSYSGPATTATIEGWSSRIFIAKEDGVEIGRFTVGTGYNDWLGGTNFSVSNVVDWINDDLPAGWTASLVDDSRRAAQLSTQNRLGLAFTAPVNVKDVSLNLYCAWDIHADLYQKQDSGSIVEENVLVAFNKGIGLSAQDIFMFGTPGINDMLVWNNAFANSEPVGDRSQVNAAHSHVVIAHNSWSTQGVWLRADLTYQTDGYCLLANNVAPELRWYGTPDPDAAVTGNHVQAVDALTPSGTTSGGNKNNLFVSEASGNFAPKGALLSNLKPAVVQHDLNGAIRQAEAPAGAVAA